MGSILVDLSRSCLKLAAVSALALGAILSPAFAQAPASGRPIVAVLPLANNSGDAAQDFFAEGMTDEIATALTGVPGIDVVARSSSFQFKQPNRDIKAIGAALNVSHLVQGSARLADDRVRLSVLVAQVVDGAQLWSKEFEAPRSRVFDLEEEIAHNIAAALKASTNPDQVLVRSRASDFEVYLDFLRANGYALTPLFAPSLRGGMPDDERKIVERTIPRSDTLARRATTRDPKSAEGFVE